MFVELVRQEIPLAILPTAVTGRPDVESIVVGELTLSKGNQCSSTSASTSTNKTCTPLDLSTEKRLGTRDKSAMGPGNVLDLSLSKEKSEHTGTKEHCDKNLDMNLMTNENHKLSPGHLNKLMLKMLVKP